MNILMINYEFPPLGGGGGVAAKQLAEGFIQQGHQVDYVTSYHPELKKNEVVNGIKVHRVRVGRKEKSTASARSMLFFPITGLAKTLRLCSDKNYDFINTHFAIPSGPLGVVTSKIFGLQHILSIHGADIHDPTRTSPYQKWYYKKTVEYVINYSHKVVAQSSNTKQNALKYYKFDKNIEKIPLPYKPYEFEKVSREELGLEEGKFYLISIGRLVERKGFSYLIESLPKIGREDVELIIVGSGPLEEKLKKQAKELNIEDKVHLTGYIEEEKKFQYLAASDIYVLSSIHEGFGIVLQEAMQVGLPIVATNKGGQEDILKEEVNALLVEPENPLMIAKKVERLLNNTALRQKLGEKSKTTLSEFSLDKVSKQYLEL